MSKKFDPEKSFMDLPILWWVVGVLLFISFAVATPIALNTELIFRWDSTGFNNAVKIFTVPLGISALIIPFVAILAANHRSVQANHRSAQTKEQIKLTSNQNYFSNYFTHLGEFIKYIDKEKPDSKIKINNARNLHHKLFPNLKSTGELNISEEITLKLESEIDSIISFIRMFNDGHKGRAEETLIEIHKIHENLCALFNINFPYEGAISIKLEHGKIVSTSRNLQGLFAVSKEISSYIKYLLAFDENHKSTINLNKMTSLDISKVPQEQIEFRGKPFSAISFSPFTEGIFVSSPTMTAEPTS